MNSQNVNGSLAKYSFKPFNGHDYEHLLDESDKGGNYYKNPVPGVDSNSVTISPDGVITDWKNNTEEMRGLMKDALRARNGEPPFGSTKWGNTSNKSNVKKIKRLSSPTENLLMSPAPFDIDFTPTVPYRKSDDSDKGQGYRLIYSYKYADVNLKDRIEAYNHRGERRLAFKKRTSYKMFNVYHYDGITGEKVNGASGSLSVYGLPTVMKTERVYYLCIGEGEKFVEEMLSHNIPAVHLPNDKLNAEDAAWFRENNVHVFLCPDKDDDGVEIQHCKSWVKTCSEYDIPYTIANISAFPDVSETANDLADYIAFLRAQGLDKTEISYKLCEGLGNALDINHIPKWLREEMDKAELAAKQQELNLLLDVATTDSNEPNIFNWIDTNYSNKLRFNILTGYTEYNGEVVDLDRVYYQNKRELYTARVKVTERDFLGLLVEKSHENEYNPIVEYIESTRKSAPISLDNLSTRYFNTSNPIYDLMMRKWLIASVARAMNPGCKVDNLLVLLGDQSIGKTTFFEVLFNGHVYENITDFKKDDSINLSSKWVGLIDEIDKFIGKKEAADLKAFITRKTDIARPSYGRQSKEYPRRSVLAGTTNNPQFLTDPTGNRRYWIIDVRGATIPMERLQKEADGIWHSALLAYEAGEQWWLEKESEISITEMNEDHLFEDPWYSAISEFVKNKTEVKTADILEECLHVEASQQNVGHTRRVGSCLKDLGFDRKGGRKGRRWEREITEVVTLPTPISSTDSDEDSPF